MTFTEQQKTALNGPLNRANVKTNPRGFDYIEGWRAITEANRIFGFDGWDRQTIEMRQLGEPEQVNGNWRVAYHCRVRVTVRTDGSDIVRDGSGYGSGIVKDIRDAHESAIKEAETDAMKRALMTFGNPFGLALYDKEQTNVCDEAGDSKLQWVEACKQAITKHTDSDALKAWWNSDEQKKERNDFGLSHDEVRELKDFVLARLEELGKGKAKAA